MKWTAFCANSWVKTTLLVFLAVAAFQAAFEVSALSFLILAAMAALFGLSQYGTGRHAFYSGLIAGFGMFAPQLGFFWTLFGAASAALWAILAFWTALFVWMSNRANARFGFAIGTALAPILWTGLEYFRSELYFLRFSWLNAGSAFASSPQIDALMFLGVYGAGYAMMTVISAIALAPRSWRPMLGAAALTSLCCIVNFPATTAAGHAKSATNQSTPVRMAGIEMEFPAQIEVLYELERLAKRYPKTRLLVLSEYTFEGPVPDRVREWCRKRDRYLIAGGKEPADGTNFFNTVYVISPQGDVVFHQAKAAPIQFFKDGLAAKSQQLWASPWGKLGLCICYDLSYSRVVDPLINMGAQALIVPAMDVEDWGLREKRLHTRIARIRAAELGIPIFRITSSGISQIVDRRGRTIRNTENRGGKALLAGILQVGKPGMAPPDRISVLSMSMLSVAFIPLFMTRGSRCITETAAYSTASSIESKSLKT